MKKSKSIFDYIVLFAFFTIFLLFVVNFCYAQAGAESHIYTPEAGSLALISTTGLFGWLIRFARKSFHKFKRCFDVFASIVGLVLASPIVAFTAILIKIVSPGPVFFKQQRVGQGGKIFNLYKMRTMKVDAEKDSGPVWAKENDSRYIKFGKIMRKAHIDELPQLLNVLKGGMSIIGPRPERPVFVEELSREIVDYRKRLKVKPGITGLAQVRQKYDDTIEDVRRKVKFDLLYIRRMCLAVDMRILGLTVVVALTGKGAR